MRFSLFVLLGIFIWAGTISINYGNRTFNTPPRMIPCSENVNGKTILEFLHTRKIVGIRDNGHVLTIGLSPEWSTLPSDIQSNTIEAVVCYAKAQKRSYQIIETLQ